MKKGSELEQYVKYVYETLLNLKGENIIVSTNAILIGRTGAKHEIDIFYQFSKAGITHKVAIECKDRKEALAKGEVQEFFGKIEDISNIIGVIVARNGFQSGAEIYGKYKGILLLKTNELPTILDLISKKITKFFLPDTNDIGEPFWTLMEVNKEGNVTGSYYTPQKDNKGNDILLLLFSKKHAQELIEISGISKQKYVVRGLRQYHLKGMLLFVEQLNISLALLPPYRQKDYLEEHVFLKTANEIRNEFLLIS